MKKRVITLLSLLCVGLAGSALAACELPSKNLGNSDSVGESSLDKEASDGDLSSAEHKHTYVSTIVEPTCVENGLATYTCACGDSYTEEISATGEHTWGDEYGCDETYHWLTCLVCETPQTKEEHIDDGESSCSICQVSLLTEGVIYQVVDGYAEVVGYEGASKRVRIASVYKGLPVTGIADEAFKDCTDITKVEIPDSVGDVGENAFQNCHNLTSVIIPDGVTEISDFAFQFCDSLTSVEIPDSVTVIGKNAFEECHSLTNVKIPNGVTSIGDVAFWRCYALTEVVIPDSVTTIGSEAFWECTGLKSLTIGSGVTSMGRSVFGYCTALTELEICGGVSCIGEDAFGGCSDLTSVEIPNSVATIGDFAFWLCESLESVEIPDSVTTIGDGAFRECTSLTNIEIPDSVTTMGTRVFQECSNLKSVVMSAGLVEISELLFYECVNLTSVEIPNSVTSIGYSAFSNCSSLTSMVIPNGITSICGYAFYNCSSLTSVLIPDSVTSIGDAAFEGCSSLISVEIPDGVTSIEEKAFENCSSLTNLVIGNGVKAIRENAFENCSSLVNLEIPGNVEIIWGSAFKNCVNLINLEIYEGVTSIYSSAFAGCAKLLNLVLPDSMQTISQEAFTSCRNLTSLICPAFALTYLYTSTLQTLVITSGEITEYFGYNDKLTSVTISNSVTAINDAFKNCTNLNYNQYGGANYIGNEENPYAALISSDNTSIGGCTIHSNTRIIAGYAFYECRYMSKLNIPANVTFIGNRAFQACIRLTTITVDNNNTAYKAIDGNLYTKDGTTFIQGGTVKTAETFVLPSTVTTICDYALQGCNSMKTLVIGKNVKSIGYMVFFNGYFNEKLCYMGTEEDWLKIEIDSSNNWCDIATRYYYSESQPTTTGNYWHYDENGEIAVW